ncbi:MAG TPA: terminase family protein [Aliidongia sp.]|nr:terminase family protein [Aliidongia sp.]
MTRAPSRQVRRKQERQAAKAAVPLCRYQIDWMLDKSRFKIGMFARQTGKTFTTTLEIADDCYAAEAEGRRARWVILSRGERQAKEAIEGLKLHAQAYGLAVEELEYDWKANDVAYKALEIVFPGGSRVTALPANPDTARGFSANVFLDEFAFHRDSREIWKALFPVISAGFRIIVTSTPNGKGNKFYELMTAADGIWSRHTVDIYRAVAEGLPRDIDELRAGLADEDGWAQEFELHWLDEASAWLPYDLISSVEHDEAGRPDLYRGGPCFLGNDIGRKKDLWVGAVIEPVGDVHWLRELAILKGASFARQDEELDRLMATYNVARACMDETGMGMKPVEDAKARHGQRRIEGITFTQASKLTMATLGKEAFEDRTIRIPMGDVKLRKDLHLLKKVSGPTGLPRFVAEDDDGTADSHADRAWSIFLALTAAGRPIHRMQVKTSGVRRATTNLDDYLMRR